MDQQHELLRQPSDLSESRGFAASGRESLHHVREAVRSQRLRTDGGCLVQKGRHDELHVTTGIYKNMWNAYINAHNWKLNLKK